MSLRDPTGLFASGILFTGSHKMAVGSRKRLGQVLEVLGQHR